MQKNILAELKTSEASFNEAVPVDWSSWIIYIACITDFQLDLYSMEACKETTDDNIPSRVLEKNTLPFFRRKTWVFSIGWSPRSCSVEANDI